MAISRNEKISIRKAQELNDKGIVNIYDNPYESKKYDWKLDTNEIIISPDGKTKVSYKLLKGIRIRVQNIIGKYKKLKEEQENVHA